MYLILVEEDHVGAHGVHQLNPLGESHCEVFRDVKAFLTDVKMLKIWQATFHKDVKMIIIWEEPFTQTANFFFSSPSSNLLWVIFKRVVAVAHACSTTDTNMGFLSSRPGGMGHVRR